MDDYLDRACEYLGVDKGSVINPRIQGDDYVLIVDKGIAGGPKYYIPLSKLDALENGKIDIVINNQSPASAQRLIGSYNLGLNDLNYRELQELAKEFGVPANQKADDLRAALALDEEE